MVNEQIVLAKIDSIEHHLARIFEKRQVDLEVFLKDLDRQESILFNFQMAIQNCIDVAAHIVGEEELGLAGSTNELFYLLEGAGIIDSGLTEGWFARLGSAILLFMNMEGWTCRSCIGRRGRIFRT